MIFDHTNKWYIHNPESTLENETHKAAWDFEIQTDHLILASQPDIVLVYKKREPEKIDKWRACKRTKKATEHEDDGDTNCNWCVWNIPQKIAEGTVRLKNQRTREDHPNYSIVEIGLNTEKIPEDLLSLRLQWKTIS